jgi:TetR/AcrR family tetracycline transcriptional repressor
MSAAETPTTERLSRERILDAATRIVDEEGPKGLSMRRLAQELDVWPMSVYRYFQDKAELVDAVVDRATADIGEQSTAGGSWKGRLRSLLRETRAALAAQPAEFRVRFTAADSSPAALRVTEAGLADLREGGFSQEAAGACWRALLAYTIGFAGLAEVDEDEFDRGLRVLLDGLEAELGAGD